MLFIIFEELVGQANRQPIGCLRFASGLGWASNPKPSPIQVGSTHLEYELALGWATIKLGHIYIKL
ncbi:hypothetical protein HYC85_032254 [Camellia sinensis]|uniref:Uncharacterized protein n=1 Tax=Camellia sinensis TaxID=4442 RepID=A0A7J7FTP2_CAMSI|nr:hypothetical protein HYC85_032254 [Camellia sinensis]